MCVIAGILMMLSTWFGSCDDLDRQYGPALQQVPAEHRALVQYVTFVRGEQGMGYPSGEIDLPERAPAWALLHEIGHLVSWTFPTGSYQLMGQWKARFLPTSAPTPYGRVSMFEDFAESYRLSITGQLATIDPDREAWFATYAFAPLVVARS